MSVTILGHYTAPANMETIRGIEKTEYDAEAWQKKWASHSFHAAAD